MGPCISKKKASSNPPPPNSKPADPVPVRDPPASVQIPEKVLDLKFLFKPVPDQTKAYLYNTKNPSVFIVPASVPFKFHRSCSVSYIENDKFFISGGYENEDEMSNHSMIFDISTLSGEQVQDCPCNFISGSLLYYGKQKIVFLLGGIQNRLNDSNFSDICDFKGADFCLFDLNKKQWEDLPAPPKQLCLPTCYLKENFIFMCGGFSSFLDDNKFNRKTEVYTYDILNNDWTIADFDYQVPVLGSLALNIDNKVLVLGGYSEPNITSSKVFLLANNSQVNNLKDFQSPNLSILPPEYQSGSKVFFLADPDMLITFDVKQQQIVSDSLINMKKPSSEYFSLNSVSNPRASGIYVYMPECGHKMLKDYNVISSDFTTHSLKNIQYRDSGMAVLSDGRLFFAGGVVSSSSKSTQMCFIFDALSSEEQEETSLPLPLRGLRLVEHNSSIYAVAGYNEGNEREVIGFNYLIQTKEWRKLNNMMHATRYPCCFSINKHLYAIGGEVVDENGYETFTDYVQVMDLESKVWTSKVVTYPHQAKCMGCINLGIGKILIFGGEDNEGNALGSCYLFDGEKFEKKENLPDSFSIYNFEIEGIVLNGFGYIFTMAGVLLKVSLDSFEWEEVSIEMEFTNRV